MAYQKRTTARPIYFDIASMERAAREEADGAICTQIRGEWLEVHHTRTERTVAKRVTSHGDKFTYKWGKNYVNREVAERVLASAQEK